MSQELELIKPGQVDRPAAEVQAPSVAAILKAVVEKGITAADVGALEKIVGLYERAEEKTAEKVYAAALSKLQAECQNVVATEDVDGKFRYAPFIVIWQSVRAAVERNGFTLQWDQEHLGHAVKKKLILQHLGGHKRTFEWTIRLGSNAPGTPAGSQLPVLDEIADSRAKRRLLMDVLNIVVDALTPAEDVGDGVLASPEESDALFKRLLAVGGDSASQKRFLALAGVDSWDKIPKAVLPVLQRLMHEKERAAAAKKSA